MRRKYNFSVGVMFKNESHIMEEWIQHYLRVGADHIYMINHQSNDNYMDILNGYIEKNIISLYNSNHKPKRFAQVEQYNDKITPSVKDSNWFAFLDMDEFLYSRKNNNITNLLGQSPYDCYTLNWLNFGSNDKQDTPKSAIAAFTKRFNYNLKGNDFPALRQIKTLFKTDTFTEVKDLHTIDNFKKRYYLLKQYNQLNEDHIAKMDLTINHYSTQAYQWFFKTKKQNRAGNSSLIKYTEGYWRSMNTNHIEDTTLLKQYENQDNK